jgi:hypothetical protein
MGSYERPSYKMTLDNSEKTLKLRNYWLR